MSYDEFIGDDKTIDAVVRNFEVIGEAANRVLEISNQNIRRLNGEELLLFVTG